MRIDDGGNLENPATDLPAHELIQYATVEEFGTAVVAETKRRAEERMEDVLAKILSHSNLTHGSNPVRHLNVVKLRPATVSVVIPARNEARNLPFVLERIPAGVTEVILVDGHSVDDTIAVAKDRLPDIKVVHQTRRGKGNALAAGFSVATGDYVVMIDADGSMDPAEIPSFITALDAGADYAKGSRFCAGGGSDDISRSRDIGNRLLIALLNILFRTRFTDLVYGFNAFRREALPALVLPDPFSKNREDAWGDGFEIETLLNIRAARARMRITEVPSFEYPRVSGESNLRTMRDGMRIILTILRERFTRRRLASDERMRPAVFFSSPAEGVRQSDDRPTQLRSSAG